MKSRRLARIFLIAALFIVSYFTWQRLKHEDQKKTPEIAEPHKTPPLIPSQNYPGPILPPSQKGDETISAPPLQRGSRAFYGVLPEGIKNINDLPMANKPSKEWKSNLNQHLKKIGGTKLQSAEITPQESYIIPDGNAGRYVERVIIRIRSNEGEYTSFFAEVDSQSGYVLKSWGAAIQEKTRSHR
ncbi:MAG: hypothetical protein K2P81_09530 [Bacteriovoracaceae bacterium]|nr:hypothetical protein [Bacteriovoracaceae bacterium]